MDASDERLALLVVIGAVAGAINTVAGGGSLITIPALIFLGLPPAVANATNRVGVLLQSAVASAQFARAGKLPLRRSWPSLVAACAGAALGAQLSVSLDEAMFRRVIGGVMLLMLGVLLLQPKRWLQEGLRTTSTPVVVQWMAFFAIGAYGGFIQAGVGLFLLAGLVLLNGQDLLHANGTKSLMVTAFTVPAMSIYLANDLIAWGPGLAVAIGAAFGGWWGTRLAVGYGPRLVRIVLIVVVLVSSIRLLLLS